MIKCPKCSNMCEFGDGNIFGFCNKCGSNLERASDGSITVYDKSSEEDPLVQSSWERYDICSGLTPPSRKDHDIESFDSAVEMMMDEIMAFTETQKDILSATSDMPRDRKARVVELCGDMTARLWKRFESFLDDYRDYGMYEELKGVNDTYTAEVQKMSGSVAADRKKKMEERWAEDPEKFKRLSKELADAKQRKGRLAFMNFEGKWAADAEIERIEAELNGLDVTSKK